MRTKRIYINNEPTKYIIYEDGRIYSEITNKFLKPFPNPQGYYLIDIHHNGSLLIYILLVRICVTSEYIICV